MAAIKGSRIFAPDDSDRKTSTFGVAALAIGGVALAGAWIPFLKFLTIPMGGFGLVLGLVALGLALANKESGPGIPAVAVAVNAASFIVPFLFAGATPAVVATTNIPPSPIVAVAPETVEPAVSNPVKEIPATVPKPPAAAIINSGPSVGALGENVNAAGFSVGVWFLDAPAIKAKQMAVVSILCEIGNEGKEPLTGPELTPVVLDSAGRKYSQVKTAGSYVAGMELKPLVWQDQEWAFALPENVPAERVEFTLAGGKTISIDFTHGAAENGHAPKSSNPELAQRFNEFTESIVLAYSQAPVVAAAAPKDKPAEVAVQADPNLAAQNLKAKLHADFDNTTGELEEAKTTAAKAERKVKSMLSGVTRAQDDLAKAQDAKAAATAKVTSLTNAPAGNHREEIAINSALAKANVEVDRQTRHEEDATKTLAEKQKLLDAATKTLKENVEVVRTLQIKLKQQEDAIEQAEKTK